LSSILTTWTGKVSPWEGYGSLSFSSWRNKSRSSLRTSYSLLVLMPTYSRASIQTNSYALRWYSIPTYTPCSGPICSTTALSFGSQLVGKDWTLRLPCSPVVTQSSTPSFSVNIPQVGSFKGQHPSQLLSVRTKVAQPVLPVVAWYSAPSFSITSRPLKRLLSKLDPINEEWTLHPACCPCSGPYKIIFLPCFLLAHTDSAHSFILCLY
jgi:hypothetical protein